MSWVHLISFTLDHEAQIAKGKLESEGIEVFLKDQLTNQLDNIYSNAIGGVKLFVLDKDKDKALQLMVEGGFIMETEEQKQHKQKETFLQTNKCPFCESENYLQKEKNTIEKFFLVIRLPFVFTKYHCFDCDNDWKV